MQQPQQARQDAGLRSPLTPTPVATAAAATTAQKAGVLPGQQLLSMSLRAGAAGPGPSQPALPTAAAPMPSPPHTPQGGGAGGAAAVGLLKVSRADRITGTPALRAAFPQQVEAARASGQKQTICITHAIEGGQLCAHALTVCPYFRPGFVSVVSGGASKLIRHMDVKSGDQLRLSVQPGGAVVAETVALNAQQLGATPAAPAAVTAPAMVPPPPPPPPPPATHGPCRVKVTMAATRINLHVPVCVVQQLLGAATAKRPTKGDGFPVLAVVATGPQQAGVEACLKGSKAASGTSVLWYITRLAAWLRSQGAFQGECYLELTAGKVAEAAATAGPSGAAAAAPSGTTAAGTGARNAVGTPTGVVIHAKLVRSETGETNHAAGAAGDGAGPAEVRPGYPCVKRERPAPVAAAAIAVAGWSLRPKGDNKYRPIDMVSDSDSDGGTGSDSDSDGGGDGRDESEDVPLQRVTAQRKLQRRQLPAQTTDRVGRGAAGRGLSTSCAGGAASSGTAGCHAAGGGAMAGGCALAGVDAAGGDGGGGDVGRDGGGGGGEDGGIGAGGATADGTVTGFDGAAAGVNADDALPPDPEQAAAGPSTQGAQGTPALAAAAAKAAAAIAAQPPGPPPAHTCRTAAAAAAAAAAATRRQVEPSAGTKVRQPSVGGGNGVECAARTATRGGGGGGGASGGSTGGAARGSGGATGDGTATYEIGIAGKGNGVDPYALPPDPEQATLPPDPIPVITHHRAGPLTQGQPPPAAPAATAQPFVPPSATFGSADAAVAATTPPWRNMRPTGSKHTRPSGGVAGVAQGRAVAGAADTRQPRPKAQARDAAATVDMWPGRRTQVLRSGKRADREHGGARTSGLMAGAAAGKAMGAAAGVTVGEAVGEAAGAARGMAAGMAAVAPARVMAAAAATVADARFDRSCGEAAAAAATPMAPAAPAATAPALRAAGPNITDADGGGGVRDGSGGGGACKSGACRRLRPMPMMATDATDERTCRLLALMEDAGLAEEEQSGVRWALRQLQAAGQEQYFKTAYLTLASAANAQKVQEVRRVFMEVLEYAKVCHRERLMRSRQQDETMGADAAGGVSGGYGTCWRRREEEHIPDGGKEERGAKRQRCMG